MKHIIITEEIIEDMCKKLREQVAGSYTGKDSFTVTMSTKLALTDEEKPTVIVSELADRKIRALVRQCDKEVAWNGTVVYDEESNTYLIEDIFVFPQEVTASTATATNDYGPWLMQFTEEDFNKLRFHGHSHVNMGVTPSGVDTSFQETLVNNVQDFYIFAIYNKKEEFNIWVYDKVKNLLYETKDIYYDSEALDTTIWADTAIKQNVKTRQYTAQNSNLPSTVTIYPVWRSGTRWSTEYTGWVDEKILDKIEEKEKVTEIPKRKAGRPSKEKAQRQSEGYQEYRKQKLKEIENKKSNRTVCDGDCLACEKPCGYYQTYSY
jgi:hypothetical protein